MKILIIGPLGAGKSTLAYYLTQQLDLPRLNLDEVSRIKGGGYRETTEQFAIIDEFIQTNSDWVAEGCQKPLYERLEPDLIVDMRLNRLLAVWRFTHRFIAAKKLIGKDIAPDLSIQAYHYRKITLSKILEWNAINREINAEITDFLNNTPTPTVQCRHYRDYDKVVSWIKTHTAISTSKS